MTATIAHQEPASTTQTCRRVVIKKAGSYDRLGFETVPALIPGPGEVVVNVAATGVNYADCIVRMGLYSSAKEFVGWPITPGFEVAGRIGAIGSTMNAQRLATTRVLSAASGRSSKMARISAAGLK